jgi:hypothetical protein
MNCEQGLSVSTKGKKSVCHEITAKILKICLGRCLVPESSIVFLEALLFFKGF